MAAYKYVGCGLDNVIIKGVAFVVDDHGKKVVQIPNINGLHRAIASSILNRKSGMKGQELRFLRTEMGMTQAEMATLVHRTPLAISRWERGEQPIAGNAEALIRLHAAEQLGIRIEASVQELSAACVPSANKVEIEIDGSNPRNYRPLAMAA
ncbi:MAG: helix-turn-helix transcriptional regulator [Rhodospirillales bacterium]|nr:helix-turn-helix transcriptional regulator [Rhodospirillales bacterium]